MSIESFGAVVGDNDGSAFITKAEFDSLKNNFQSQIDQYNTSIDSKIDGAIASYLSGITLEKKSNLDNPATKLGKMIFGSSPAKSASRKAHVNVFSCLFLQGDGYGQNPDGSEVQYALKYLLRSGSTDWDNGGSGTYSMFVNVDGVDCFYGTTSNEYCNILYNISGDIMMQMSNPLLSEFENWAVELLSYGSNMVRQRPVDSVTDYPWGTATSSKLYFVSTPYTSGWGAKNSYWTRVDNYVNGTVSYTGNWMSWKDLDTAWTTRFINYENRTGGTGLNGAVATFYDTQEITNYLNTFISNNRVFNGDVPITDTYLYFYPETYEKYLVNLYNHRVKQALNENIKLYEGLPLFDATGTGEVQMSFKMNIDTNSGATASSYATFYLRDNQGFPNSTPDANTGTARFDVYSVKSDGSLDTLLASGVTRYNMNKDTTYAIKLNVEKNHRYFYKLTPTESSNYAYLSNFSDIEQTAE